MNTLSTETTNTLRQQPVFTIEENDHGATLRVALPGVPKEAVKLTLNQSVLQIEATRDNAVPEDWKTHSGPARNVTYQLGVRLTSRLDGEKARASLDNGVLTLEIPLREEAKPRQILLN